MSCLGTLDLFSNHRIAKLSLATNKRRMKVWKAGEEVRIVFAKEYPSVGLAIATDGLTCPFVFSLRDASEIPDIQLPIFFKRANRSECHGLCWNVDTHTLMQEYLTERRICIVSAESIEATLSS